MGTKDGSTAIPPRMLRLEIRDVVHVLVDDDPAVGRAVMRCHFGRRVRGDEMVAVVGGMGCREGFGTECWGDGASVCHFLSLFMFIYEPVVSRFCLGFLHGFLFQRNRGTGGAGVFIVGGVETRGPIRANLTQRY